VHLSQVCVLSKQANVESCKERHTIALEDLFSDTKVHCQKTTVITHAHDRYHGLKQSLMLAAHFVKFINTTASLIGEYQGSSLERVITTRTIFTQSYLHNQQHLARSGFRSSYT